LFFVNIMWLWLLFLLGAYHGLNPAMGWLFAVALGLQEKSGRAVTNSLLPLGLGHLISVALVVGVVEAAQIRLPLAGVRIGAGLALVAFGLYRFLRRRHPRWVGMRVGSGDLTLWSFLMASAHGAGLMLLPFVVSHTPAAMAGADHHHAIVVQAIQAGPSGAAPWWSAVALHTLGYLLATAAVALVVYYKVGVGILRRAWFNLELVWAAALVAMGVLTLAVG
jgi:hypothetical protein